MAAQATFAFEIILFWNSFFENDSNSGIFGSR
jgi:hypothetical protein